MDNVNFSKREVKNLTLARLFAYHISCHVSCHWTTKNI